MYAGWIICCVRPFTVSALAATNRSSAALLLIPAILMAGADVARGQWTNGFGPNASDSVTALHADGKMHPPTAPLTSGIVLVSRLSDARAYAAGGAGDVGPPPEIQTDFLPASLSNTATSYGEPGGARGDCTSNSQIELDNQIGTLHIAGDGMANGKAFEPGGSHFYAWAAAKLIVTNFTLTDRSYAYSLTGQLSANGGPGPPEHPIGATAKLTRGGVTIFEVIEENSTVTLSETGILQPDNYTLAVDVNAYAQSPSSLVGSSANFNFALGPAPTPTPTPSASPTTSLGNISTRLRVGTGNNALIGGFIVAGTQPKKVILRAIGPSMPVNGALIDPALELYDSGGGLIRFNDNWRSDQEQDIIATGIPPSNNAESAIMATLPANGSAYSAIVRGANNATGIGLVEVYDLDQTVDSMLANISTRGLVQTGDDAMIAGTIVLGQAAQRVIVRAVGPSLPVPSALADPTLELRDSNGTLIRANDNWRSDQEAEITATGIAPSNDAESAVVATLPANGAAYTAIVRGANSSTGVALVEVYALTN
jgi:hypothetical protein